MGMTACEALAAKRAREGKQKPRGIRNKKKNGRKTLFKRSMIKQAENLVLMGYTHEKVADFFGVNVCSIYKWKSMHDDFAKVLNFKRDENDSKVVRSLYEIATGYDYVEKKKETEQSAQGETLKIKTTKTKKHIPPNVGAIKLWLYSRRPKEFKPEPALSSSHGGADLPPPPPLNITYTVAAPVRAVKVTIGRDKPPVNINEVVEKC